MKRTPVKSKKSAGAKNIERKRKKDLNKSIALKQKEMKQAKARRAELIDGLRSGRIKKKNLKHPKEVKTSAAAKAASSDFVKNKAVVVDEHTTQKKPNTEYMLEGDPRWV